MLHQKGRRIRYVYFPGDAVVSLLTKPAVGARTVEVGMVGREGMVGGFVALGTDISPVQATVQGAGAALRANPRQFRRALARSAELRECVYRFSHDLTVQVMLIAACNSNHNVEQRLARWLLMMRERGEQDRIELTQHFLGAMLGVRRAGVNEAAGALSRRKLIRLNRGSMDIMNRAGVETASCACYRALRLKRRR